MNPDDLKSLLAAGVPDNRGPSAACPDEHLIAAYAESRLAESERRPIEVHLADCGHCLALVALLCRERSAEIAVPETGPVVVSARPKETPPPRRWWQLSPQWAIAAALVLVTPLLIQISRNPDRGVEGRGRPAPVATRTLGQDGTPQLQVLVPGDGAEVSPSRPSFAWTEVRGTPFYDVRIVNDAGDVVIQQRVTDTRWQAPASLKLQPGAEYFVHVDAYPFGDKAQSSEHVRFRIAN